MLGVVAKDGDRYWLRAIDKRERRDTPISDLGEAGEGNLVLAEKTGRPPRITAKVVEILGDTNITTQDQNIIVLIINNIDVTEL